jgi:hypothetical protein
MKAGRIYLKDGRDPEEFMKLWDDLCERWDTEVAAQADDPAVLRSPDGRKALFTTAKEIKKRMAGVQDGRKVLCANGLCINYISEERLKHRAKYCCEKCKLEEKRGRWETYERREAANRKYYTSLK